MTLMLPRLVLTLGLAIAVLAPAVAAQAPAPPALPYSESIPYKPRLFQVKPEKKSKDKDPKAPTPEPGVRPQPEVMPQNGPAVTEDAPITIPVSVFDAQGKFVSGLKPEDFKVLIDGPEARVLSVEQTNEPLNVLLVLDASPSSGELFESEKQLASRLIGQFPTSDKISVFQFSNELRQLAPLSTDREAVLKAVGKLKMGDGTSLYDVSRKIFTEIVPSLAGRTVVLMLTDGVDTVSRTRYPDALVAAERSGATVYPIYFDTINSLPLMQVRGGIPARLPWDARVMLNTPSLAAQGSTKEEYELGKLYLNDLVYLSGGRASAAASILDNKTIIASTLAQEIHQQYYVTFTPIGPSFIGQRKHLKVRVDRPSLVVLTRGSYIVGSPPSKIQSQK